MWDAEGGGVRRVGGAMEVIHGDWEAPYRARQVSRGTGGSLRIEKGSGVLGKEGFRP